MSVGYRSTTKTKDFDKDPTMYLQIVAKLTRIRIRQVACKVSFCSFGDPSLNTSLKNSFIVLSLATILNITI